MYFKISMFIHLQSNWKSMIQSNIILWSLQLDNLIQKKKIRMTKTFLCIQWSWKSIVLVEHVLIVQLFTLHTHKNITTGNNNNNTENGQIIKEFFFHIYTQISLLKCTESIFECTKHTQRNRIYFRNVNKTKNLWNASKINIQLYIL